MTLVDVLLNLAGLLLWLGWRALGLVESTQVHGLSLISTLQRAEPRAVRRWPPLVWLAVLLLLRPLLYWQVGTPAHWSPSLELGLIAVPFRTTSLGHMLLYSCLGFGRALIFFHLALILLGLVNRRVSDADVVQRFVRVQLGGVATWPVWLLGFLPLLGCALLWLVLSPLLVWTELLAPVPTPGVRLFQGVLLGAAGYLAWKYLIVVLLAGYVFHTHIFVGHSTLWNFVAVSGRNLLAPLRRLPLRLGRLDFAPIVAIVLVLVLAHYASGLLTQWFQHPPF